MIQFEYIIWYTIVFDIGFSDGLFQTPTSKGDDMMIWFMIHDLVGPNYIYIYTSDFIQASDMFAYFFGEGSGKKWNWSKMFSSWNHGFTKDQDDKCQPLWTVSSGNSGAEIMGEATKPAPNREFTQFTEAGCFWCWRSLGDGWQNGGFVRGHYKLIHGSGDRHLPEPGGGRLQICQKVAYNFGKNSRDGTKPQPKYQFPGFGCLIQGQIYNFFPYNFYPP